MLKQIELLPASYRSRSFIRRRARRWTLLGVCGLAAVFLTAAVLNSRTLEIKRETHEMRASLERFSADDARLAAVSDDLREVMERHATMVAIRREPSWPGFFHDLATASGEDIWLTQVLVQRQTIGSDDSATAQRRYIGSIAGIAPNNETVIALMRQLSSSPHLEHLELNHSHSLTLERGAAEVSFSLEFVAAFSPGQSS